LTFVKFVLLLVNQTLQIMKTRFLFPHKLKKIGVIIFLIGLGISLISTYFAPDVTKYFISRSNRDSSSLTPDLIGILITDAKLITLIIGLVLISFSKEKIEDEQIAQVRLDSLQWAIYLNYILMLICVLAFNGFDFLAVMGYNILSPLIFFIVRFRWKMHHLNNLAAKEESLS